MIEIDMHKWNPGNEEEETNNRKFNNHSTATKNEGEREEKAKN